jgi:RNA polymerase sigma-70 factor, ECF subfamily
MGRSPLDDNLLIERALQGDQSCFTALIERHRRYIYCIAYKVALHEEDALDICQQVYIKLMNRLDSYQPGGSFKSWLAVMTTNTAIDFLRRSYRKEHPTDPVVMSGMVDSSIQGETATIRRDIDQQRRIEQVQHAMAQLSPQQRAIFTLRFYEDMATSDIADQLGVTNKQIRVQLCRAVQKLRDVLSSKNEYESKLG